MKQQQPEMLNLKLASTHLKNRHNASACSENDINENRQALKQLK
jgi:predicted small metal-binding protein